MAAPRAPTWRGRNRAIVIRARSTAKSARGLSGASAPRRVPAVRNSLPARSPGPRLTAARAAPHWCARKCAIPKRAPVGTLEHGVHARLSAAVARSRARLRARVAAVKTASGQKTRVMSHPVCRVATLNPVLYLVKSAPGRRGRLVHLRAVVARKHKPAWSPGLPPMVAPRVPRLFRRNHAILNHAR